MSHSGFSIVFMVFTFCLSFVFSQATAQQQNRDQKSNWKIENPFKKKQQYVDPIAMTDRMPKNKFFQNPFKATGDKQKTSIMGDRSASRFGSRTVNSNNKSSDLWKSASWNNESQNGNWFSEWDQRNRQFWRTTGENMSQFALNSAQRLRENTRNMTQAISENVKLPQMKPIQWNNGQLFKRDRSANELPKNSTDWRGSERRIKY